MTDDYKLVTIQRTGVAGSAGSNPAASIYTIASMQGRDCNAQRRGI